jgi:hypothetical protein
MPEYIYDGRLILNEINGTASFHIYRLDECIFFIDGVPIEIINKESVFCRYYKPGTYKKEEIPCGSEARRIIEYPGNLHIDEWTDKSKMVYFIACNSKHMLFIMDVPTEDTKQLPIVCEYHIPGKDLGK